MYAVLCVVDKVVLDRQAVGQRCHVTDWDNQVSLFELGMSTFSAVDVVVCASNLGTSHFHSSQPQVANAGIKETGDSFEPRMVGGKPSRPITATLDVSLNGVVYCACVCRFLCYAVF